MKQLRTISAAFALVAASCAHASYFEFCDFEGEIQDVREQPKGTYELAVQVAKVSRAKEEGYASYTACREHEGKLLEVTFAVSEIPGVPAVGDEIAFSRSVIDGVNQNGAYAGTSINTRLHKLRKQNVPSGR